MRIVLQETVVKLTIQLILKQKYLEFVKIKEFSSLVIILKIDFKVNASNILRFANCSRKKMQTIKTILLINTYWILNRFVEYQNIYVAFDIKIEIC